MFFTISIQTYNRANSLKSTLDSMLTLRCPEGSDYEILVVDNNSNDNTSEVIKTYTKLFAPRFRSVFERKQGLCHARNLALNEAKGEVVCFLDDDVIVDSRWLEAISEAFKKYSAILVGGRSYLIYPDSRPEWLPSDYEILLSKIDYGDKTLVDTDKELFGLNFCVLKKVAIDIGGFDIRLGRKGKSLLSGEEKYLQERIKQIGGVVVYEPNAIVGHVIPKERLTKKWLFKRIYNGAIANQRILMIQGKSSDTLMKSLVHFIRCWAGLIRDCIKGRMTDMEKFSKQYYAIRSLGILVERIRSKFTLKD